ncbi:hypothetical protein FRC02_004936 [Tulasnella sp. 418]|nr:hypothetical protein FRC02_004936 [Tulasnella sp. 418]
MSEIEYIDEKDWPGVSEVFGIANPYQHLRDRPTRPISSNAPQRLKSAAMAAGQPLKRSSIEIHGTKEVGETRTAPASASPHRRGSPKITEQPRNSPRRESQELATSPRSSQTPPRSSIEIGAVGHYRSNSRSSPKETQQTITTSYVVAEEKDGGMYTTRPIQRPTVPTTESYNHGFTYGQPIPRPSTLRSARSPSVSTNDQIKLSDISRGFEGLSLSSTSSNRDSMTTVTSDGFTDYLSEESEAELQRQAEEKAAILRKTRAEEAEFNAARRGLQNIDLRTPAAWTISATRPQPYDPSAYAGR